MALKRALEIILDGLRSDIAELREIKKQIKADLAEEIKRAEAKKNLNVKGD